MTLSRYALLSRSQSASQTDSRRNAFQFALADTVFKHVYPLIGYAALLEKALGFLGVKAFSAINLITHLDSSVLSLIIEHDNRFTPFRQAVVFFGPKPFLQKQAEARMARPIFAL